MHRRLKADPGLCPQAPPSRGTDAAGLEDFILSGLGAIGGSAGPPAASVQAFTGAQARTSIPSIACPLGLSGVLILAISS